MIVSEATRVWERWRERRRLRRNLAAWAGSCALGLLVLALVIWGGFPPIFNVGEKGEALSVKLGNPEGEDLPLSVSAVPDQAMQAVMSAQRDSVLTTVEETRAVVEAPPAEPTVPSPASPPAVKPAPATKPTPAPQPTTPVPEKPAVTEKVIRGSEKGNASELILKPQGERISQNAYWPVYLFMPLPTQLDATILNRIKATDLYSIDERRNLLLQAYSRSGANLTLTKDPGLEVRPAFWEILEGAGYDIANADYKRGKDLKPVVITFYLGVPKGPADSPPLLDVELVQSSGSGPVDEAVLYAFQRSSFANGTGQQAQGRYTYDFALKK